MLTMSSGPFTCINCGRGRSDSIFRIYGKKEERAMQSACHLRLTVCESCGSPVDDYVELENSILLIDAVLLKSRFFRHLFNCDVSSKSCVKLAVILLVADSVCRWSRLRSDSDSYVQLENLFYVTFARMLVHNFVVYSLIVSGFLMTTGSAVPIRKLVPVLILCSFAKLMNILTVLWPSEWQTLIDLVVHVVLVTSLSQSLTTASCDEQGKERLSFLSAAAIVLSAKLLLLSLIVMRLDHDAVISIDTLVSLIT